MTNCTLSSTEMSLSGSPWDGHEVREFSWLHASQMFAWSEQFRSHYGYRLNRLHWGHTGSHEQTKILRVLAMGEHPGVGAVGNFNTRLDGFAQPLLLL